MKIKHKASLTVAAFVLAMAIPAFAESPALALADGEPWNATMSNGDTVQMSFLPDGTIRAKRGLFRMTMAWTATDDGMCIEGAPDGDRCLTLRPEGSGFLGISENQVLLTLTR